MKLSNLLAVLIFSCLMISCSKSDDEIAEENMIEIEAYLAKNNLQAQSTASGLYYIIEKEGNGQFPNINSNVTVHYEGYFPNGDVFDSSLSGSPASFPLTNVITGWQEGIPKFSKGGSGKLLIPAHLGYGRDGRGSIPGEAVLIFDIQLINF